MLLSKVVPHTSVMIKMHSGSSPDPTGGLECPRGSGDDVEHIFVITEACVTAFVNNNF